MSLGRHALAVAVLAGLASTICVCPTAGAQSTDPAAADALFRRGREDAEREKWAAACPKFAESQRLDPAPGTLLNLADCEEHTGRIASAYEHYKSAIETMAATDDRIPFAKQHMASIEKNVPHLTLLVAPGFPDGAEIRRDDVELRTASFGVALPVDPGPHVILVTAPGRVGRKTVISLAPGEARTLTLDAGPVGANPPPTSGDGSTLGGATGPTHADSAGPRRIAGLIAAGVGLAGVVVGAVAGGLVLGKKSIVDDPNHCDQSTHACDQTGVNAASDGRSLSVASTVAFTVGAAFVAAGAVLYFTAPSTGPSASRPSAFLAPEAYRSGGGLRLGGSF